VVPVITAATGFLIAVFWFDLMFAVQVWRHRHSPDVPETVLASIATYYRRVTMEASPMGRLVGLTMVALLVALVVQPIGGEEPWWVSVISIPAALLGIGLAAARIFETRGVSGRARIRRRCKANSRETSPGASGVFERDGYGTRGAAGGGVSAV
jgi:hypothetical protein